MKGTQYMKIFKIIDEENDLLSGVLLYYEKSRTAIIELPEYLDEWNAPLLFTGYINKKMGINAHFLIKEKDIYYSTGYELLLDKGACDSQRKTEYR